MSIPTSFFYYNASGIYKHYKMTLVEFDREIRWRRQS